MAKNLWELVSTEDGGGLQNLGTGWRFRKSSARRRANSRKLPSTPRGPNWGGRPAESEELQIDDPESDRWTLGESLRSLGALLLTWIGWVALLAAFRVAASLDLLVFAAGSGVVGAALLWISHRLSRASRRFVWAVPLLFGSVYLGKWFLAGESGESLFAGTFLVGGGLLALLLQAVFGKRQL